jgi:F-type H+-transporting ATPase subunit gamma
VNQFIASKNLARADVGFVTIGKKGYEHFSKRGYTIVQHAEKFADMPELYTIEEIAKQVFDLFESGTYSHVYVAFSNLISTFAQEPYLHEVLPLSFEGVAKMIKGITPTKGKYSELFKEEKEENNHSIVYTYEPSIEEVLRSTILTLATATIYHAILEAKASEHSARMIAMHSASDKALEMGSTLTLSYNKARQSAITREVSEIIGGIEALAK